MKTALAAIGFLTNDLNYNFDKIKETVKKHAIHADLILFGESFLQGFDCLTWDYSIDIDIAVSQDSSIIDEIRFLCKKYKVAVSFGYIEKDEDKLYSSQLTISKDGKTVDNSSNSNSSNDNSTSNGGNDSYSGGVDPNMNSNNSYSNLALATFK